MEIARKVTSELKEDEITRLSEVINEALYGNRETLDSVRDIFLSYGDASNFIIYDSGDIVGISQIMYLERTNSFYFKVGALLESVRKRGFMSRAVDLCIDYVRQNKAEYAGVSIGNPYVMSMFHEKGFPLPEEMGERKSRMLNKAKEILDESKGTDFRISDMFIISADRFNCPPLANAEDAYSENVAEFVKWCVRTGDRLFMIKEFEY